MRGGTSKSLFFAARDLPGEAQARDAVVLAAFGSPDSRQIDGLGGADPLTSKLAIISPSGRSDADVDYLFGQVGIATPNINYRVNCGNTAAAVGVYAVQEGLVPTEEGKTRVRIFSVNNGTLMVVEVPTRNGAVVTEGDFRIGGVPRAGAEIPVKFLEPAGGETGRLLPTGAPVDEIAVGGTRIRFSLVDCGNLYALIPAATWWLTGSELPAELEAVKGFKAQIEEIRDAICQKFLPDGASPAANTKLSAKLKVAIVGPAASYTTADGKLLERDSMDLVARIINQERVHKTFAVTGAISVAAAAAIPGTVVNELCGARDYSNATVRIGHPQGLIQPVIESSRSAEHITINSVQVGRTARRILEGFVYVPAATVA